MSFSESGLGKKLAKFVDSQFLWGGVALISGAALYLLSVKWLIGLGGFFSWVALLRAGFFEGKSPSRQFAGNLLLSAVLVVPLFLVWRKLPRPPNPTQTVSKQDIRDAVQEGLAAVHASRPSDVVPNVRKDDQSAKLATKAEIAQAVREAIASLVKPNTLVLQPPLSGQQIDLAPKASPPAITSAPKMFNDGEIKGVNFGPTHGQVSITVRVKPSRQSGSYKFAGERLLGNLINTNIVNLDDSFIERWTNTSILVRFRSGYKDDIISMIDGKAKSRSLDPPKESDLEVGFRVVAQSGESEWFYP